MFYTKIILYCIFILVIISCGRKPISIQKKYSKFKAYELIAANISEEITGNDEVTLIIYAIKDTIPKNSVVNEWIDSMTFDKNNNSLRKNINYELNNFDLLSKERLLFILIETDNDNYASEQLQKLRNVLSEGNYQNYDSLTIHIKKAILDDDLLGVKFYTITELINNSSKTIHFSGVSYFDKYYYKLNYRIE